MLLWKNASKHTMSARVLRWVSEKRHPTLLEEKEVCKDERGERWGWGIGGEREEEGMRASSAGRRDIWARMEVALHARTVAECNM